MIYGYARVSTNDQSLSRQLDSINQYKKLDRLFTDKKSGKNFERKGYQELKENVKKGDEVIVHALDRFGRNKDLIKEEFTWFKNKGVVIRILNMPTTLIEIEGQEWVVEMINNIILEVLASFAQNEREELITRVKEGMEAAKKRGVKFGRPRLSITSDSFEQYQELVESKKMSVSQAIEELGISRKSWYNLKEKYLCN